MNDLLLRIPDWDQIGSMCLHASIEASNRSFMHMPKDVAREVSLSRTSVAGLQEPELAGAEP